MPERREFEFEGGASPAEAAEALCRIADGIRARALWVSLGEEEITVYPDGDLRSTSRRRRRRAKRRSRSRSPGGVGRPPDTDDH